MEVHRTLGPGLLEVVYKDAMEYEFQMNKISYQREKPFVVQYKEIILPRKYYADFVAFDDIILEVKADTSTVETHLKQTLNYLALAKTPLGLIINFGEESLRHKRVIHSAYITSKHIPQIR